jgi:hypothetical protein
VSLPGCSSNASVEKPGTLEPDENVVATSGSVEISSIRVVRHKGLTSSNDLEPTKMEIELWFTSKAKGAFAQIRLLKVVDLGPIEDNTGKLLSTRRRLQQLPFWFSRL